MLYMLNSRAKPGISREHLIERLKQRWHLSSWELVRTGQVSNVFYKIGAEPGITAVIHATDETQAKSLLAHMLNNDESFFEIDLTPINQFPHFDE